MNLLSIMRSNYSYRCFTHILLRRCVAPLRTIQCKAEGGFTDGAVAECIMKCNLPLLPHLPMSTNCPMYLRV